MLRTRFIVIPVALAAAAGIVLAAVHSRSTDAGGGFVTQDLSTALEPIDLANTLLGGGISVSNVTYVGDQTAAGTFSGGSTIGGAGIGFDSGVILSSGNIVNIVGPNDEEDVTTEFFTAGDTGLNTLIAPNTTNDAAVLEFDFTPQANEITFQYVFASDEYNEYVNTEFDDVFAFFVNGANCATVAVTSGTARVSINTINNGNPFGTMPNSNPQLFVNNDFQLPAVAPFNTEMDGFTTVLTCQAPVNAGITNHMKLAIADTTDWQLDSVVFLKAGSFTVPSPTPTNTFTPTNTPTNTPTFTVTNTPTITNTPQPGTTATSTPTNTATNTPQPDATVTNTATPTMTLPPDATVTSTATPTPTNTLPPELTATSTATPTNTNTPQPTLTVTLTATATVMATATVPAGGACDRADFNGDGQVTTADVVLMATNLGKAKKSGDARFDVDADGEVDAKDLVTVVKCRNAEKHSDNGAKKNGNALLSIFD